MGKSPTNGDATTKAKSAFAGASPTRATAGLAVGFVAGDVAKGGLAAAKAEGAARGPSPREGDQESPMETYSVDFDDFDEAPVMEPTTPGGTMLDAMSQIDRSGTFEAQRRAQSSASPSVQGRTRGRG